MMVYIRHLASTVGMLGLILLLYSANSSAEDEYYTWVDQDGVVNYSERNPQGFEARLITRSQRFGYQRDKTIEKQTPTQPAPSLTEEEERDIDVEIATQTTRIHQEIAAAEKSNCNIGKLNLAQLESYNRIKVQGIDGQVRVLSEQEKQSKVDAAKKTIAENCR
ncbi:MAG: DUF4124 domain-containing protein [Pseudomonadales bacterium]